MSSVILRKMPKMIREKRDVVGDKCAVKNKAVDKISRKNVYIYSANLIFFIQKTKENLGSIDRVNINIYN